MLFEMSETDKKHVGTHQMCINTHTHTHICALKKEILRLL